MSDTTKELRTNPFRYEHPKLTKAEIEDVIESYKRMKWWP
jgi:hypothetical protein